MATLAPSGPAPAGSIDATLLALADPVRRRVVELLERGPRRAGELAGELALTPPAMSRHLRVLRTGGLVDRALDETDARATLYRLRPERFLELRVWLGQFERFWNLQLAGFKRHAERKGRPR